MTKKVLVLLAALTVAAGAYAQNNGSEVNDSNANTHKFFTRGYQKVNNTAGAQNLTDHGGPVMVSPNVVCIFWGFGTGNSYTTAMQNFRNSGMYNYNRML